MSRRRAPARRPSLSSVGAGLLCLAAVAPAAAQEANEALPTAGTRDAAVAAADAAEADTVRLGVDEAVRRATQTNEQVLVARAEEARAAGIVKEVRADALPSVSANFGYTRNLQTPVIFFNQGGQQQQISIGSDNEYSFGLSLQQTVFDFSLGPARAAARMSADATDALVDAARTDVALRTRTSYYDVLLAQALVQVQERALAQAKRRLTQVEDFYEAGTASEFELLTAQVEVDNVRPDLIEARNQLALDENRLKRTVGLALDRELALTDSFPEPSPLSVEEEELVRRAIESRSDLRGQRIRVQLQGENLTAQEREDLPALSLTAGLQRRASSDDFFPPQEDFSQTATAGLAFSVPLFDGRANAGRVQQARAEKRREEFRLRQLREDIRLEVQQASQALSAARERIRASEANVNRAERALQIAQTRFENGLSTQVELNDAELAVTRARSNLARALHAYAVARARIMAATGQR